MDNESPQELQRKALEFDRVRHDLATGDGHGVGGAAQVVRESMDRLQQVDPARYQSTKSELDRRHAERHQPSSLGDHVQVYGQRTYEGGASVKGGLTASGKPSVSVKVPLYKKTKDGVTDEGGIEFKS